MKSLTFHIRKNHLNPALTGGWIEMTDPGSPRSPVQRSRRTQKGGRLKP
jgi:ATP-dependent DNA helicase RecG